MQHSRQREQVTWLLQNTVALCFSTTSFKIVLPVFWLNKDDIFATEAIKPSKPSQKAREKERTFESNLFDDNIDIFADLTVKPKEKSKKKAEAKSIFDDDMGKFDFLHVTQRVLAIQ